MIRRPPRSTRVPCRTLFRSFIYFFFNDTATTEIYTLSLHDALPISISSGLFSWDALLPPLHPTSGKQRTSGATIDTKTHFRQLFFQRLIRIYPFKKSRKMTTTRGDPPPLEYPLPAIHQGRSPRQSLAHYHRTSPHSPCRCGSWKGARPDPTIRQGANNGNSAAEGDCTKYAILCPR